MTKPLSPSLFLLFNHALTPLQEQDARASLGIRRIISPPSQLKDIWSTLPADIISLSNYLKPVQDWLSNQAKDNDYVLIQGDFGACYIMVNFAFEHGLIPIYSTTKREAKEDHNSDGSVHLVHRVEHVIFRKYGV
ncbi:MAG: CRISPR-associated protein Csx20 [Thermodesulfobacteriota bacterium]|nr:CRISPR-associated protein Csx20 [Thermodesulfobacteriota bacterium]